MSIPVTNFGKVTVSIGYDAAATSIVLTTGHGSRLPSTFPYPLTWWNATDNTDPADDANKEIVSVTARAGDTLTVVRAQEGTSASTKNTGGKTYKMVLGFTKAMYDALLTFSLSQSFRGLTLQVHPDNDKAPAQVRLIHADAIVMDDGQEITDWNDLDASLAAAGIGGLDTGTEAASTWYQVIAAYNGTTKGIYFHRAKDYFLDEDITAGEDASQGLRSAVDNSTVRIAQGFQVGTAGLMEFIDVKLLKTGTPTGNYWFTVEANSGGVPSNTPLATSDKYDVARLTTTATVVRLPFRTPASLSAATQYHIVMYGDFTVSATSFANWRMDGSAATYVNGSKALFDSDTSTWTSDTDDDMWLKVYITRNDTALTKPAGYTQSAVIGWCYNNASSNLIMFAQHDHLVFGGFELDWKVGSLTSTTPLLVDLFALIPPTSVTLSFLVNNGAASHMAFGVLSCTDVVGAASERKGMIVDTASAGFVVQMGPITLSPYQGVMFATSAGTNNVYVSSYGW